MERWIGAGIGALALVIGLWNTWTLSTLDESTGSADEDVAAANSPARMGGRPGGPGMMGPGGMGGPGMGGPGMGGPGAMMARGGPPPEMMKQFGERDTARTNEMLGLIKAEAEAFAKEEQLDAATTEKMIATLEERMTTLKLLRDDMRAGKIQPQEAKTEFESLQQEMDAKMIAVIGEERFERLEDRLESKAAAGGHGGPGGMGGMGGPMGGGMGGPGMMRPGGPGGMGGPGGPGGMR